MLLYTFIVQTDSTSHRTAGQQWSKQEILIISTFWSDQKLREEMPYQHTEIDFKAERTPGHLPKVKSYRMKPARERYQYLGRWLRGVRVVPAVSEAWSHPEVAETRRQWSAHVHHVCPLHASDQRATSMLKNGFNLDFIDIPWNISKVDVWIPHPH